MNKKHGNFIRLLCWIQEKVWKNTSRTQRLSCCQKSADLMREMHKKPIAEIKARFNASLLLF
jgi:hypothetical protein